jgi:hypothetical protein
MRGLPPLDFEPIGWYWNGEIHYFKGKEPKRGKMHQQVEGIHHDDVQGNPAGGTTTGRGIEITWQDGPLGRGDDRIEPNGAFVEGVIAAAIDRLEYYNAGKFRCRENSLAITKLQEALQWLDWRTRDRETRDVEGTHNQ